MSITEKTLEVSLPSSEFESPALVITRSTIHKESISPQSPFSDLSQKSTAFTEIKNSLHGSQTSLSDKMVTQEASASATSIINDDSKFRKKL